MIRSGYVSNSSSSSFILDVGRPLKTVEDLDEWLFFDGPERVVGIGWESDAEAGDTMGESGFRVAAPSSWVVPRVFDKTEPATVGRLAELIVSQAYVVSMQATDADDLDNLVVEYAGKLVSYDALLDMADVVRRIDIVSDAVYALRSRITSLLVEELGSCPCGDDAATEAASEAWWAALEHRCHEDEEYSRLSAQDTALHESLMSKAEAEACRLMSEHRYLYIAVLADDDGSEGGCLLRSGVAFKNVRDRVLCMAEG